MTCGTVRNDPGEGFARLLLSFNTLYHVGAGPCMANQYFFFFSR